MFPTKKTIEITCEGAVSDVKEILRQVGSFLEDELNGDDVADNDVVATAFVEEIDYRVNGMSSLEQIALIVCYGLDKAYNEYQGRHGIYEGEELSKALCYHILRTQLEEAMELIENDGLHYTCYCGGFECNWRKFFLAQGEIEVISKA